MENIAFVEKVTSTDPKQGLAFFSTSGSASAGFMDEAMSEILAKDTQRKNALTTAIKKMENNPDPLIAFEVQTLSEEFSTSRNLGAGILGKIKATFEKVVLNSQ